MTERFQTFITRLRPHRIAVLTDINDPDWQSACTAILEFLFQVWGGAHSLIIPTDGSSIADVFWKLLSAFDPDIFFIYRKTYADLERVHPADFARAVAHEIAVAAEQGQPFSEDEMAALLRSRSASNFSLSDDLSARLLIRLAPFHFENQVEILPIFSDQSPGYPLTSVCDVVDVLHAPDTLFRIVNNLPDSREAPPPLWLAAEPGLVPTRYEQKLLVAGVTTVPKFMNTESDAEIIGWGIHPSQALRPYAPFAFSTLGLVSVRSVASRQFSLPSIIVRGDSFSDFCLYYGLSRLHNRAIWLPGWFLSETAGYSNHMLTAVRKLQDIGYHSHNSHFAFISASLGFDDLRPLAQSVHSHIYGSSASVEDGLSPSFIGRMVEHPAKWYIKKNLDRITTHQLVDDRLPGYFESPVPEAFEEVRANSHRWLVEINFTDHQTPRHPALGPYLASGSNVGLVRAANDGATYLCPGAFVMGDDIELQIPRLTVSVPPPEKIFNIIFAHCGYDCSVSDKGAYESTTIAKFGSLTAIADTLKNPELCELLKSFLNLEKPAEGVFDEGVPLGDKRRYANFDCIVKMLGSAEIARSIIDSWIAKQILYRGFIFKCARCSDASWFSVTEISQFFTCRRCGTSQQYTHASWRNPSEPSWFYKLDEIVYQMLHHNGDVALLTLRALSTQSRGSFQYTPELSIRPKGAPKSTMEIDACCILDGKIFIGEAKSVDSLASKTASPPQVIERYRKIADLIAASGLIFSTSAPEWNEATRLALDASSNKFSHLHLYSYRAANLRGN